jgi:hypothetical protein
VNTFTHVSDGKIFVLTDKGRQIGRIRGKYIPGSMTFQEKYQKHAPLAWVQNGWIEEVDWRKHYGNKS